MATGSYEGSLSIEGIPDYHEPRSVMRARGRVILAAPSSQRSRESAADTKRERERRQECQRLGRMRRRGNKKPTLDAKSSQKELFEKSVSHDPPKRSQRP